MGFNLYGLGNIKPCWVSNGILYYELPFTGKTFSCETSLQVSIPKQTNLFASKTVAFYLEDENNTYVGRYDGRISIYRKTDNMLVGLQLWVVPPYPPLCECGFYKSVKGNISVKLDTRDCATLYVEFKRMEARLKHPMYEHYISKLTVSKTYNDRSQNEWYVVDKEGNYAEIDAWNIQDDLWKRNCRIFL